MNPFTHAVLKAGLVSPDQLAEMKRLRPPNLEPDAQAGEPQELSQAVETIRQVLQSEGLVAVRETDLDTVRRYTETAEAGQLHVETLDGQKADFDITFGLTPSGEVILPWKGDGIGELMTGPFTWLDTKDDRIQFASVRDLFFGQHKAFMVCARRV